MPHKSISSRIGRSVFLAILACIVVFLAGILLMAAKQDRDAFKYQQKMVEGGLQQIVDQLQVNIPDFANWSDLFKAVEVVDDKWFGENLAGSAYDTNVVDFIFILKPDYSVLRAWHLQTGETSSPDVVTPDFRSIIEAQEAGRATGNAAPIIGYTKLGADDIVYGSAHILPFKGATVEVGKKPAILVMGNILSEPRIGIIGKNFLLNGLTYRSGDSTGPVEVKTAGGQMLGSLTWDVVKPGTDALKDIALLLAGLVLLGVLGGLYFAAQARANAEKLSWLNAQLSEKMANLEAARTELNNKHRMEELGKLTATVAHEIRNPLGTVRTSAFLLERKLKAAGLNYDSLLQRISSGVTRCDNIITQLLDFSRNKQLACNSADLDQWLLSVLDEQKMRLSESIELVNDLQLRGLHVPFDPARLERAVINLISNAAEAMLDKEGKLKLQHGSQPRIEVTTKQDGGDVLLTVRDNGPGMQPEILERIREPLFTTKSFGTGLGVPAVEQIAAQHGGSLEISSSPGDGATFTLRVPTAAVEAA